jgi:hypothetical protein
MLRETLENALGLFERSGRIRGGGARYALHRISGARRVGAEFRIDPIRQQADERQRDQQGERGELGVNRHTASLDKENISPNRMAAVAPIDRWQMTRRHVFHYAAATVMCNIEARKITSWIRVQSARRHSNVNARGSFNVRCEYSWQTTTAMRCSRS